MDLIRDLMAAYSALSPLHQFFLGLSFLFAALVAYAFGAAEVNFLDAHKRRSCVAAQHHCHIRRQLLHWPRIAR